MKTLLIFYFFLLSFFFLFYFLSFAELFLNENRPKQSSKGEPVVLVQPSVDAVPVEHVAAGQLTHELSDRVNLETQATLAARCEHAAVILHLRNRYSVDHVIR